MEKVLTSGAAESDFGPDNTSLPSRTSLSRPDRNGGDQNTPIRPFSGLEVNPHQSPPIGPDPTLLPEAVPYSNLEADPHSSIETVPDSNLEALHPVHLPGEKFSEETTCPRFWSPYRFGLLGLFILCVVGAVTGVVVGTRRKPNTPSSTPAITPPSPPPSGFNNSSSSTTTKPLTFAAVFQQNNSGEGIGFANQTHASTDLAFPFDYDRSGKSDHIVFCQPGSSPVSIWKNNENATFSPVYSNKTGLGGYDFLYTTDKAFAFDYDHSGYLDHLIMYRPNNGAVYIAKRQDNSSVFIPVPPLNSFSGIGGYNLASAKDLGFAFDYNHSGMLDHLVFYRPGGVGTIWILKNNDNGTFSPVYQQGDPGIGIGGYDLKNSASDRAFAFDYDHSGMMDHLVLYRPGKGQIWILKNTNGVFTPVYQQGNPEPGNGIGGFSLSNPADTALAWDCMGTGLQDCLVFYTPGFGGLHILTNNNGTFTPVFQSDSGVAGFDLKGEGTDQAFAFDYQSSGHAQYLALYRQGTGLFSIVGRS